MDEFCEAWVIMQVAQVGFTCNSADVSRLQIKCFMEILDCIVAPPRSRCTTGKVKPGIALVEGPFRFLCNPDRFSKERLRLRIALLMRKRQPQSLKGGSEFRSGELAFYGKYLPVKCLRF